MLADIWPSLIETTPEFLALLLVAALGIRYRGEIRNWMQSATRVSVAGFEIERDVTALRRASAPDSAPGPDAAARAVERLRRSERLATLEILWVDDHPDNNKELRLFIAGHGPRFTLARSNADARAELRRKDFDIVISDIARDAEDESGFDLAEELVGDDVVRYVILFVAFVSDQPVPSGLFGMTNDTAELLHLILDAAERI